MKTWTVPVLSFVLVLARGPAWAESPQPLRERTRDQVAHLAGPVHWDERGQSLWYQADLGHGRHEIIWVDLEKPERRRAFDHEALAQFLSEKTGRDVQGDRLPVEEVERLDDGTLRVLALDRRWLLDPETDEWSEGHRPQPPSEPGLRRRSPRRRSDNRSPEPKKSDSPDGRWAAFIQDHNVFLRNKNTDETSALSSEGTEYDGYEPRLFWSPDSSRLLALRSSQGDDRRVYLVESSPPDRLQPRLLDYEYRKPGDRIPITKPHLFDVENREEIPLDDALYSNP